MTRTARLTAVALILVSGLTLLPGSVPQVATGTWQSGADLTEARAGGAAVLLEDSRVLLFGGKTSSGGATNAVQVFDAQSGSWSDLGVVMLDARSGHSATLLAGGRVLLAGGENSSGPLASLEIFDPETNSFRFAGMLLIGRKGHGAARLPDGRVWIAGGSTGSLPLASSEIFDPETGQVSSGAPLPQPRTGLSVTALLDGKVLIAGGSMGNTELASTLLFDPATNSFAPGAALTRPRSGHTAVRFPYNNSVLLAGGSSAGTDLTSAELYVPWTNRVTATAAMTLARGGAASSNLAQEGMAVVAGGSGLASSEYYGFATIRTDKDDYSPGEVVAISGKGWQPGETVVLRFTEVPATHEELSLTAVADAWGNILSTNYLVESHDIGVRFYLTATGSRSQAQTSFTDGNLASSITFNLTPASAAPNAMLNFTSSATCQNGGSPTDACAANGFTVGGPVPNGYMLILEQASDTGFLSAFPRLVGGTVSGSFNGAFPAPAVPGTYFFRVRHQIQSLPPNTWLDATSNAVMVVVQAPAADTTAPQTMLGSVPANPDSSASANFTFSGSDDVTPPASLTFQCSLDGAGFAACMSPQSFSGLADGSHNFQARARDAAGNFDLTPASFTWTIDSTDPVITPTVVGTLGANGWYASDVEVSWSVNDPGSGIAVSTGCGTTTLSSDTSGTTLTCSATNGAGLLSSASVTIKLDKSGPSASLAVIAGTSGANGWYVSNVTVDTDGSDSLSSPVTCTADQIVSAEGTTVVNGSCTNDAGLTTDAAPLAVKLDKSGPSASLAVIAGTPGANGWYVSNVTVDTDGSDSLSSPVTCTADQIVSAEGTPVVNGSCTNGAGLTTDAAPLSLMIDKAAPVNVASQAARLPDSNGWYNHAVLVSFTGRDALSGVANCSSASYGGPDSAGALVSGSCTDLAGNSASGSFTLMYDATAPVLNPAVSPNPVVQNNSAIASANATDNLSNVAGQSCSEVLTSTLGAQTVNCTATDVAGNTASASASYNVIPAGFLPAGTMCLGQPGHQVLPPLSPSGTNLFQQGRTVPVKFRVCDASGASVGPSPVVASFNLAQVMGGSAKRAGNSAAVSALPDMTFRWSATDQMWILNLSTRNLAAGATYVYRIHLVDGSDIYFQFTLK